MPEITIEFFEYRFELRGPIIEFRLYKMPDLAAIPQKTIDKRKKDDGGRKYNKNYNQLDKG